MTLVGPGGAGKTQLALAAARVGQDDFLDGVWLVQLAALSGAGELTAAIADALGLAFSSAGPLEAQLVDALRRKELLLALDNFEQIITPTALDLLCRLLKEAPGMKLLVTSRERLNLAAEWVYDVAGLPYPAGETVAAWRAIPRCSSSCTAPRASAPISS